MEVAELKTNYDWIQAFKISLNRIPNMAPNSTGINSKFTLDDVDKILFLSSGYNDGDPWIGVFILNDGRYASIVAWCDYTGWD